MKIGILKERQENEARVAISPETIKKLRSQNIDILIESGAGLGAAFSDEVFSECGATVLDTGRAVYEQANVLFKIRPPCQSEDLDEISLLKKDSILIGHMSALSDLDLMESIAKTGVTAFGLELLPRITRAQSMDVLSSQSNLAGYKAVLEASVEMGRAFPMMMTAAGTVAPAKVFIMGVGVAGLQAIATAKRMGAIVTATDVRPATKEQVESLGGKFLEVDPEIEKDAQTEGGYAKEMPPEYFEKQKLVVASHIQKQDVVITTALVPGKKAPTLITRDMVESMPMGSVIVDLAAEAGGNCELTKSGDLVKYSGVSIIGYNNLPSTLAEDASTLFSKNLLNFLLPLLDSEKGTLNIDWEDEIIKGSLVCKDGEVVHPSLTK